jgi:hypothetical protein
MTLTVMASLKFNVHTAIIFKAALNKAEIRRHPKNMRMWYDDCLFEDKFPPEVEDFALDLLAGRIKIRRGDERKSLPSHEG